MTSLSRTPWSALLGQMCLCFSPVSLSFYHLTLLKLRSADFIPQGLIQQLRKLPLGNIKIWGRLLLQSSQRSFLSVAWST